MNKLIYLIIVSTTIVGRICGIGVDAHVFTEKFISIKKESIIPVYGSLKNLKTRLDITLQKTNSLCLVKTIIIGEELTGNDTSKDNCLGHSSPCFLELDLNNKCDGTCFPLSCAISSVAAAVGIVFTLMFIIIAIKTCCSNPQGLENSLQARIMTYNPFYVNLLFRRECEQELQEIDSHYEEIE